MVSNKYIHQTCTNGMIAFINEFCVNGYDLDMCDVLYGHMPLGLFYDILSLLMLVCIRKIIFAQTHRFKITCK